MSERKVGMPEWLAAPYGEPGFFIDYGALEARVAAAMTEAEVDRMVSEGAPVAQAIKRTFDPVDVKPPNMGYHYIPNSHRGYSGSSGGSAPDGTKQDEVVYGGYRRAKIEKYLANGRITIRFVEKDLIPPTMDVRPEDIKWGWGGSVVNPHVHCPKCGVAWKSTMMFQFPRFDCPQCGAKKEDHAP